MTKPPKVLVVALVIQLLVGAAFLFLASRDFDLNGNDQRASAQGAVPTPTKHRFDARRAHAFLVEQVERFGPRAAGTPASRRLAERLRGLLPRGRFEPFGNPTPPTLRNVVGVLPGRSPAIVVGAHYDTEARPQGHVGANDGAAGTAAVVELARALRSGHRRGRHREIRFVLFDGEEEAAGCRDFERCGMRGSKAYVARHGDEVGQMVLLDYIAQHRVRIPRESLSDERLWARLRAAARRVGVLRVFPDRTSGGILDDHVPFLDAGIPAIDLIDFDYEHRDTLEDTVDKTSARSLDAVGEAVAELLVDLRRVRG
jgi:hypothetical protein